MKVPIAPRVPWPFWLVSPSRPSELPVKVTAPSAMVMKRCAYWASAAPVQASADRMTNAAIRVGPMLSGRDSALGELCRTARDWILRQDAERTSVWLVDLQEAPTADVTIAVINRAIQQTVPTN